MKVLSKIQVCVCVWERYFNALSSPNMPRTFPYIINRLTSSAKNVILAYLLDLSKATDKACYLPVLICLCSSLLSGGKSSSGNMSDVHDCLKSPLTAMTPFLLLSSLRLTNNPPNRRRWALFWVGVLFFTNFPNRSRCSALEHSGNDYRFPSVLNLAP